MSRVTDDDWKPLHDALTWQELQREALNCLRCQWKRDVLFLCTLHRTVLVRLVKESAGEATE